MSTVFTCFEKLARLMLDKSVRGGTRQQHWGEGQRIKCDEPIGVCQTWPQYKREKNIQRTEFDDRNTSNDQSERKERQNHQFPFFTFFFSKNPALNTRRPSLKTFVYQSVCVCTLGTETVWGHLEQNARPSSFFCWFRRNRCVRGAVHKANDRPLTSHTGHGVVWRGSLMTSPSNAPLFLLWNCVYNSSFCFYFKAFRPKTIRIDSNKCW